MVVVDDQRAAPRGCDEHYPPERRGVGHGGVSLAQEHYLGPLMMAELGGGWMAHAQLAIGLTRTSDNLVRLAFGHEF